MITFSDFFLYFQLEILYLTKLQFLSYCPRCSQAIRFPDSWKSNNLRMNCKGRKSGVFGLAWLKMTKLLQKSQQNFQKNRYGQFFFVYLSHKQRILSNHLCLFVPYFYGPSVRYFLRSCWSAFSDFCSWCCIVFSSKNWQSLTFVKNNFWLDLG